MNKRELSKINQPKTFANYRYNKEIDAKNKLRRELNGLYEAANYTDEQRPIRFLCSDFQEQTEIKNENNELCMPSCKLLEQNINKEAGKKSPYITQKVEEIKGYIKEYHVEKIMAHHVLLDKEYFFEGQTIHLDDIKKAVDDGSLDPNRLVDNFGLNLLAKIALALEYPDKKLRIEILKFIGDLIDKGGSLFAIAEGQQLISLAALRQIQMNVRACIEQKITVPEPLSLFAAEDLECRVLYKNLKENTNSLKINAQSIVVSYVESSSAHINTMSLVLTEVIAKFDDDYKRDKRHNSLLKKNSAHRFYEGLKNKIEALDIDTVDIEKAKAASKIIQCLQHRISNNAEDNDEKTLESINASIKQLGEDANIINLLAKFEPAISTGKDTLLLLDLFCKKFNENNVDNFFNNNGINAVADSTVELSKIELRSQLWSVLTTADKIMVIDSDKEIPDMATEIFNNLKQIYHSLSYCAFQSHPIVYASFNQFVTKIINIANSEGTIYSQQKILDQMPCLIEAMTELLKAGQYEVAKNLLMKIAKISSYDDIFGFAPGVYCKFMQVRDGDYEALKEFITDFEITPLPAGGHKMTSSPIGVGVRTPGTGSVSDVDERDVIARTVTLNAQL